MSLVSIIVPCFNEHLAITAFIEAVSQIEENLPNERFEILFVDDGSTDGTLDSLRQISAKRGDIHYLSFSRNFGKEAAMLAGLTMCKGDYAAIMDADLQDPPALLPEMLKAVKEDGFDCAGTRRVTRKGEPIIRSIFAKMFYKFINAISDTQIIDGARDYRLMNRTAINAVLSLGEYNRFSKGINEWVGFKTKWIEFENVERVAGETKWSLWSLFKYSVEGVVGFSTAPLSFASLLGLAFVCISFISIIFLVCRQLFWHASVSGWTSMICVIIFFCGIQLLCLGIIGKYLANTYMEVKKRPHYILKESSIINH